MFFIALLIAATMAIAGAAAYFSVYGLAYTFGGVFWSVVIMGASLEAGKLVAASFLYRYWTRTHIVLKAYLIAGVAALMILTSIGIFGYLSAGYQQDVLPLKQKQEQIVLLEDEKSRALARKKQIDDLLAGGPAISTFNKKDGTVDNNATRALRETTRSRESLVRQYKSEQEATTKRVSELDVQLLALKQDIIKTEAKVGPITYIAKATGLNPDNATMYLIFVIIFAFDPMAVALTLAVNVALRLRKEDKEREQREEDEEFDRTYTAQWPDAPAAVLPVAQPEQVVAGYQGPEILPELAPIVEPVIEPIAQPTVDPIEEPVVEPIVPPVVAPIEEPVVEPLVEPEPPVAVEPEPAVQPAALPSPPPDNGVRFRPYPQRWTGEETPDKIRELIQHHKYLKAKQDNGDKLTQEELWEMHAVEGVLRKHGIDLYL